MTKDALPAAEAFEAFQRRIAEQDAMAAARALAERHGVSAEDVRRMIRAEAADREADAAKMPGRPRPRRDASEREAVRSLAEWLENGAKGWAVGLDFADIAAFILSHRQACAWAVLTAKARNKEG